jgi:hypothetical protein
MRVTRRGRKINYVSRLRPKCTSFRKILTKAIRLAGRRLFSIVEGLWRRQDIFRLSFLKYHRDGVREAAVNG